MIKYIMLDPRFDRSHTHHFVLLNHFWHNVKVSFPFYLLKSMSKAVERLKKNPIGSMTLHEGLLFLIYEHFKAQTISKTPPQVENVESRSFSYSFSSDDTQSLSLEDGVFLLLAN